MTVWSSTLVVVGIWKPECCHPDGGVDSLVEVLMQVGNSLQIRRMMILMILGVCLGIERMNLTECREQSWRFAANVFGVHRVGSEEGGIFEERMPALAIFV